MSTLSSWYRSRNQIVLDLLALSGCFFQTEDCVWEMPRCDPPYEMMKKMRQYTRNLPPPTLPPITVPKPTTLVQTKELTSTTPTAKPTTYNAVSSKFTFEMLLKTSPAATAQPQKECSDEKESGSKMTFSSISSPVSPTKR